MRLTTDLFAYCAERLPRWNTISISGYHIREAGSTAVQELAFTLANGIAYCEAAVDGGPLAGRVRRAPLLLLQRAQPLLPGGGEVPRGAAAVGGDHARALRRDEPEGAGAALPRADRRLDADRAAAGEQHRARRDPGAVGGVRRRAVAPHELVRRGAGASDRALAHASRCARSRSSPHEAGGTDTADPLGGSYFIEALTDELEERARELIERIDELGGAVAAIEQGFVQREIEEAAFRYQRRGRGGRARDRRRQPLRRGRTRSRSSCTGSTRRRSGASSSGPRACGPSATPRRPRPRWRGCGEAARGDENLLPPMREALRVALHRRRDLRRAARRSSGRTTRSARERRAPLPPRDGRRAGGTDEDEQRLVGDRPPPFKDYGDAERLPLDVSVAGPLLQDGAGIVRLAEGPRLRRRDDPLARLLERRAVCFRSRRTWLREDGCTRSTR